jgi:hypothetical protein
VAMRLDWYLRKAPVVVGAAMIVAASAGVAPAWAQGPGAGPVHPHQAFLGLINDSDGAETPVTVNMACFGPVRPGETGHPMAGQTVGVAQPEVIVGTFGNTGAKGTSIEAVFGTPQTTTSSSVATGRSSCPPRSCCPARGRARSPSWPCPRAGANGRSPSPSTSPGSRRRSGPAHRLFQHVIAPPQASGSRADLRDIVRGPYAAGTAGAASWTRPSVARPRTLEGLRQGDDDQH